MSLGSRLSMERPDGGREGGTEGGRGVSEEEQGIVTDSPTPCSVSLAG